MDFGHFRPTLAMLACIGGSQHGFRPISGLSESSGPDLDHFRPISMVLGLISPISFGRGVVRAWIWAILVWILSVFESQSLDLGRFRYITRVLCLKQY